MSGLSLLRRFARTIALVLLAAGPAGLQHAGRDDFACAPVRPSDDATTAMSGAPVDAAEHCLVCHWTRSLRSRFASAVEVCGFLTPALAATVQQPLAHRAPALDRLPARAPPRA